MHGKLAGNAGYERKGTHDTKIKVKSTFGGTSTPLMTSIEILSTARDTATEMKRDASAR